MSAVLNTVYNNYLTSYAPKNITRYDTHKKSELRSVYNTIVKINKESPWYLPTTSKETQRYAIDLKENARELHNTIAYLGGLEENGMLRKKTAFSSNEEVASATFVGSEEQVVSVPSFQLEVQALASSQENFGQFLNDTRVELPPDTYSFDIAVNDMNYEFQFAIGETETNLDVQERLQRLINNAGIGLKATIEEAEGRTSLKLVSEVTGASLDKPLVFTISDDHTSKTSGAVDYFGLNYVSRKPSNAHFTINGEERTASSNHFTIGKLFEVQLNGISPPNGATSIGLKTDVESLTDNVLQLVNGYNSFIKAAATYQETQPRSRHLIREMSGLTSRYSNFMESMGVNLKDDGELSVDQNLLSQTASETSDLDNSFGFLKDFTGQLIHKTKQVSLNPMDYVEKKIVAYKNPGHNFASPYVTSAYSGMMFNGYC